MALAAWPRLHSTSGGVSDTELKELAVSPTRVPSAARAVTTVTPVASEKIRALVARAGCDVPSPK